MNQDPEILLIEWKEFISKKFRGKKKQEALFNYVKRLIDNESIIILDFSHLALLLGIESGILAKIVNHTSSFYYQFEIPKKKGGMREISAPYPVLLNAQNWIYENMLSSQSMHHCAKGFIKNTSIVDNAKEHLDNRFLLKMDIENFFPSIPINRIIAVFRKLGYTKKISYYLASICCLNESLPQGAVTSPALSNLIAKRLDRRLFGLANRFNVTYTRYADDLTFSGNDLPIRFISYVEKIVEEEGFKINNSKTKLLSEKKQKIVTGVSISSGKLTIPKKAKREVRKNIFHVLSKGLFEHQQSIQSKDPIYLERLLGYLYFWLSVEPENNYVKESIISLKTYSKKLGEEYS